MFDLVIVCTREHHHVAARTPTGNILKYPECNIEKDETDPRSYLEVYPELDPADVVMRSAPGTVMRALERAMTTEVLSQTGRNLAPCAHCYGATPPA